MTDAERERETIHLLADAAAQAIAQDFAGFGQDDELWPTIGYSSKSEARDAWKNIIHNAIDVLMAKPPIVEESR